MITADEMSHVGIGTEYPDNDTTEANQASDVENELRRLCDGGINSLDTSPVAGRGRSEIAIGDFLQHENCRDDVFLTSKCGYEWELDTELSRDLTLGRLQQELEESMNRMRVDVLDLYLLNTVRNDFSFKESYDSLNHIKDHRNVRNVGLKDPSPDQLRSALEITNLDFVQIPYSLFDREPFNTIEPICANNEVRIIISDPLGNDTSTESSDIGVGTSGNVRMEEYFRKKLEFVLEAYFDVQYSDEPLDALLASWAIGSPGVHSSVVEHSRDREIGTILRVLDVVLTPEDYRAIDHLLTSLDR